MKAHEICAKAAELVSGDRDRQHGAKSENFQNIANMWNAYLHGTGALAMGTVGIRAHDVPNMMVLMKVARTLTGEFNPDDYIDMAGYAGCGGEIAGADRTARD